MRTEGGGRVRKARKRTANAMVERGQALSGRHETRASHWPAQGGTASPVVYPQGQSDLGDSLRLISSIRPVSP